MFKKGYIPWNKNKKGYKHTEISKKNMSKGRLKMKEKLGYINSSITREKISKKLKLIGRIPKSAFKKGHITWNKGIKMGINLAHSIRMKNRKVSVKTRKKMRESQLKRVQLGQHNNYKGDITPINEKIRKSIEIKLWRKSVFERDNFTCQKYGIKGGELQSHHINNFADFPELQTSINNGITLSEKAHREFHKKYGRKNNTREQLKEFLN